MEILNHKKLNDVEVEEKYQDKSHIHLQLWKARIIMWISIQIRKVLERIQDLQP
jgi:hypothetical protein